MSKQRKASVNKKTSLKYQSNKTEKSKKSSSEYDSMPSLTPSSTKKTTAPTKIPPVKEAEDILASARNLLAESTAPSRSPSLEPKIKSGTKGVSSKKNTERQPQNFVKIAETGDANKLLSAIFTGRIVDLASRRNEDFLKILLEKFSNTEQMEKLVSTLLEKINLYETTARLIPDEIRRIKEELSSIKEKQLEKITSEEPIVKVQDQESEQARVEKESVEKESLEKESLEKEKVDGNLTISGVVNLEETKATLPPVQKAEIDSTKEVTVVTTEKEKQIEQITSAELIVKVQDQESEQAQTEKESVEKESLEKESVEKEKVDGNLTISGAINLEETKATLPVQKAEIDSTKEGTSLTTDVVFITAESLKNSQATDFIEIIDGGNFYQLLKAILEEDINELTATKNASFIKQFLAKFTDFQQIDKIASSIIDKIEISKIVTKSISDDLNFLKADILLMKSENILSKILKNKTALTVLSDAESALILLEQSYAITYRDDSMAKRSTDILDKVIGSISKHSDRFQLLEMALTERGKNLPGEDAHLVNLMVKLGNHDYNNKLEDLSLKSKVLNYNSKAYNICINQSLLTTKLATELCEALYNLRMIANAFYDFDKAEILKAYGHYFQTKYLKEDSKDKLISKMKDDFKAPFPLAALSLPILKHGLVNSEILAVKKLIQNSILTPIQKSAEKGKWTEKALTGEYGVCGYLDKFNIKAMLGSKFTDKNYEIALKLCFEAINIGVVKAKEYNPICAVIFTQKYPQIIKDIITNNPEYFVDSRIVEVSLLDANKHSVGLFGKTLKENTNYNSHFEEWAIKNLQGRVEKPILSELAKIITEKRWDKDVEDRLKNTLSDGTITKAIGNNWSEIADVLNIVRIMAFREISRTIDLCKSKILSPIECFVKQYPKLSKRISADHSEMLVNNYIENSFTDALHAKYKAVIGTLVSKKDSNTLELVVPEENDLSDSDLSEDDAPGNLLMGEVE